MRPVVSAAAIAGLCLVLSSPTHGAITLPGIYNTSGASGGQNYTNASSIPVSGADLINGLAPIATNYVACCEAAGGTTAPMTDGQTAVTPGNLSEPTSAANSLFDLQGPQPWHLVYQLPTGQGAGWDLSKIVTTTGHQDSRVNQSFDILVSYDNSRFVSLSDGSIHTVLGEAGTGFQYLPSSGNGGAAQSTLGPASSALAAGNSIVRNAKYVEFVALNGGFDVFRELDVSGVPGLGDLTKPGDAVSVYPAGSGNPGGEEVFRAIDNVTQKYLNQSGPGSGLIVTPSTPLTQVNGLRIYTANDYESRDPASYVLEGSNDGGSTWNLISSGLLNLPSGRNAGGNTPIDPIAQFNQLVTFENTAHYSMYRLTFPTLKGGPGETLMQIAEVEFLGTVPEPSTIVLAGLGLTGLLGCAWRGRRQRGTCAYLG